MEGDKDDEDEEQARRSKRRELDPQMKAQLLVLGMKVVYVALRIVDAVASHRGWW